MRGNDPKALSIGAGVLRFDRFTSAGAATGFEDLGEASTCTLNHEITAEEKYTDRTGSRTLKRKVITRNKAVVAVTFHDFTTFNLALAMLGVEGDFLQSASSATAESLTASVVKGRTYRTGYRNVSAVVVRQGATVLVEGTDYTVDAANGLIKILASSATVTNGSAIEFDATVAAIVAGAIRKVAGGTESVIEGSLLYVGDPTAGPEQVLECWKVSASPSGEIPFITTTFGGFTMNFEVLDDSENHPDEPYYRYLETGSV